MMMIRAVRSLFPVALLLSTAVEAQNSPESDVPTRHNEATVAQLQAEMASGELTSEELTQEYIARINGLDSHGPGVNSVIELNPDTLQMARHADALRRRGVVLGPLHGIPVLLKDNIDTGDRMQTGAGSFALVGAPAVRDSTVAANLRAGGAVILGKTTLSEWANFRSFESISGWSGRGGQAHNPYGIDRNACGSSSGSGAAAAAALSVIQSRVYDGRDAATGSVPLGWRARFPRPTNIPSDYTKFLDPNGLKGARIGITRVGLNGFTNVTTPAPVTAAIEAAFKALSDAGATVIDLDAAGFTFVPAAGEFGILLYDFKNDVRAYFATRTGVPVAGGTLQTAIDFNNAHADVEMPFFNQDIFDLANSLNTSDPNAPQDPNLFGSNGAGMSSYNIALDLEQAAGVSMDQALSTFHLDAVVSATDNPAWSTDLVFGDHFIFGTSGLAAGPGYPIVQVPAGMVFGVPLGISFFGTAFSEPTLIKLASGYEAATQVRAHNLPTFAPTVPFDHIKGARQQQNAAGGNGMRSSSSAVSSNTVQGAAAATPNQAARAKVKRMPHNL